MQLELGRPRPRLWRRIGRSKAGRAVGPALVLGAVLMAGCANNDAPPPEAAAATPPPAPLSEADKEKQALEKLPLQLTSPLSPSFVPAVVRKPGAAPETFPGVASLSLCTKAAAAKKAKDADTHAYCIEAHKDGRRVVHPVS